MPAVGALGALSVAATVDLRQYNAGMDQIEQRAARATQSVNTLGSTVARGFGTGLGIAAATTAIDAFTSSIGGAASAVIGMSSQLEQARIGFTAFMQDGTKANAFIKQLQDFAAHTTFEFPGLLQASRQLMGMGVQAEQVIPLLKDIAGAVMAVGGGEEQIKRVNLAITQMMAAGKVNAQDMNQLAQAGIPAWKMLADSMGMSIGRVRELSKQGQISSAQMLKAFDDFVKKNNLDDLFEKSGKTWQAATSNILDGLRNISAEGFEPLFNIIRDFAVQLADALTGDQAKQFAADLRATMTDVVSALAPVKQAITDAFAAFQTGGIGAAFTSLLQSAQKLAQDMFGAGVNVVTEFAGGLLSGAGDIITQAANFIADTIASYLIGSSPPPVGPLSQIANGGKAVIEAYVEGMQGGLSNLEDLAQGVVDALGNVNKEMTFAEGRAALQAAGTDMHALEAASNDVQGVMKGLDQLIKDNSASVKDYQNAVLDIKSAYEGAIEPLQKQVDALKETNDLAQKQADIQDRIRLANLKGQLAQAQGDPVKRAQLQMQLDTIDQQEKSIGLQESQLRIQQQQQDLADKAAGKKPDNKDNTATQQQLNALASKRLGLQQQQNAIQQQMEGMVDKEAVARIKGQQAQAQAAKDQRDINNEIANLNRELQAAPLEQQIKDLKAQEQALLEPIQARIQQQQREGQALQEQRQQWQGLKADIADVMQQERERVAEAKKNATEAAKASKAAALDNPMDLAAIVGSNAVTEAAQKVGHSFVKGIGEYFTNNAPALIGGAIGAVLGGSAFGPLGAVAGAAFGSKFVARLMQDMGSLENIGSSIAGKLSDALNIDTGAATNSIEAFGIIFDTTLARIKQSAIDWGGTIAGVISDALNIDTGAASNPLQAFEIIWSTSLDRITQTATAWSGTIAGIISDAFNIDTGAANNPIEAFGIIFDTLKTRVAAAVGDVIAKVNELTGLDFSTPSQAVESLSAVWEGVKGTVANAITDIIRNIGNLTGTDVSNASTNAEALSSVWDAVQARVISAIQTIVNYFKPATDEIVRQWNSVVEAVNTAEFKDNVSTIINNVKEAFTLLAGAVSQAGTAIQGVNDNPVNSKSFIDAGAVIQTVVRDFATLTTAILDIIDTGIVLGNTLTNVQTEINKTGQGIHALILLIGDMLTGDRASAEQHWAIFDGLSKSFDTANASIQQDWTDLLGRMRQRAQDLTKAGQEASAGVAQGITQGQPQVDAAITQTAAGVIDGWAQEMQSKSPSAVMAEQGTFVGQGLAQGITDSTQLVLTAVQAESDQMLQVYASGFSAIHEQTTQQLDEIYTLVVDKGTDTVGAVTNEMASMLMASTDGFSAIHTGATQQLDEIYALLAAKGTDMVGQVAIIMSNMLTAVTSQREQWAQAGQALGEAFSSSLQSNMTTPSISPPSGGAGAGASMLSYSPGQPVNISTASKDANLRSWAPILNWAEKTTGIPASLLAAIIQAENGGGQSQLAQQANNYFSISAVPGRQFQSGVAAGGRFASYASPLDSLKDFLDLIMNSPNYSKAYAARSDPQAMIRELIGAHYIVPEPGFPVETWQRNLNAGMQHYNDLGLKDVPIPAGAGGGRPNVQAMSLINTDQVTAGRQAGLTLEEAKAICGPYAAILFMQAVGRPPNLAEAKQLATTVGWTTAGMGGTGNFMALLSKMGLDAVRQAATPANVNQALAAGNPIAISTQHHYFVGTGGTAEGGINVGATGTVMGGAPTMTLAQINALGGGINDMVVLLGTLDKQGTQTFNNLTKASGQMGPPVEQDTQAQQVLATSTQSLSDTIAGGLVPSGLQARDAVGAMALGVQPLIAQFANGQITTDELGQSIVGLASSTGLTTQPLAQMQAGTLSTNAALRQVLDSLIASDPAFAAIQQSFDATAQTSGDLANVLLQGLSNVTGDVTTSIAQMAQGMGPLQTAFTSGAISGDQFVQGVVALAATSGLTQQPLRMMQDGLLTSNQALAAVVQQVATADPALASMALSIGDAQQPATDAAQAFLTWVQSMQQTQQAADTAAQSVQKVPDAVADLQQPVQQNAQDALGALPNAADTAADATINALHDKQGAIGDAAKELGQVIVDSISGVVTESAGKIADAVDNVVRDALEAAKKAADSATADISTKTKGGASSKKKTKTSTDSKAAGGRLQAGIWTLVGEEGPELISPNGYVYTASETLGMIQEGVASGLMELERFAAGGKSTASSKSSKSKTTSKSKSKGKGKSKTKTDTAAKKQQTPEYTQELDIAQQILDITQQRDSLLANMQPALEAIRQTEVAIARAEKGNLNNNLATIGLKRDSLNIDGQIFDLTYKSVPGVHTIYNLQKAIRDTKSEQEKVGKGDVATQLQLNALDVQHLQAQAQIAQIQSDSLPLRQRVAVVQKQITDMQAGSIGDQQKTAALTQQETEGKLAENAVQLKTTVLQKQINIQQQEVNRALQGSVQERQIIAANEARLVQLGAQELGVQQKLLPINQAIRDVQAQIDDVQKGSVDTQKAAVDLAVQQARLRLQEVDAQGKLRDVQAGTLNMTQDQVNALHVQLESIDQQKSQLSDQSEIQQLQATIANADAQKRLIDLNAQATVYNRTLQTVTDQKDVIQNQNDLIKTGNEVDAQGAQQKLEGLQTQLDVYNEQITNIEAQNAILDAQVQSIQLANQVRSAGLQNELLTLQTQLGVYDEQIAKVQAQNDVFTAQSAIIQANNAVAAAGYNAQLIQMQGILDARNVEILRLQDQKAVIDAQTAEINRQNQVASIGSQAQLAVLQAQLSTQTEQSDTLNAQIGALNAQKKIYQDIRDLADAIANRPVSSQPAPGTSGGGGGPPGTVAATASKSGAETLYLSRGTGTDGWYTGGGQLIVPGGSSNPPSGYKVKWLASGGLLRTGETAIVGEHGPEPIVAARDLVVFPNETLGSGLGYNTHRGTARFVTGDGSDVGSGNNINVNVEYHRHGGSDYGEGTLQQVVREAIKFALRQ